MMYKTYLEVSFSALLLYLLWLNLVTYIWSMSRVLT